MPFLMAEPEMLDAASRELHSINDAVALNGATAAGAVERATNAVGGVPMVPAGGAGRGAAGHFVAPRYGFKPTVIAQPPAGG